MVYGILGIVVVRLSVIRPSVRL